MKQSAPEGYYRIENCGEDNNFVCQVEKNGVFHEQLENMEAVIFTPDYPNHYPHSLDKVYYICSLSFDFVHKIVVIVLATTVCQWRGHHPYL